VLEGRGNIFCRSPDFLNSATESLMKAFYPEFRSWTSVFPIGLRSEVHDLCSRERLKIEPRRSCNFILRIPCGMETSS
jgi:4'-phosphopantetheinyl transferase EntD